MFERHRLSRATQPLIDELVTGLALPTFHQCLEARCHFSHVSTG